MLAPEEQTDRARWGLGDVAITFGLTILLGLVGTVVVGFLFPSTPDGKAWGSVVLLTLPWLGLAGWPLFATASRGNGPVADLRLRVTWRQAGVGVGGGVVAYLAAWGIAVLTEKISGQTLSSAVGNVAQETTSASRAALTVLALCAAVGAPIVEEIAFRGLFYGGLERRSIPALSAVVGTGAAFALFHFEPLRFALLLAIGLILGTVRARTGSTGASILTHMTVNLPGALALLALR